MQSLETIVNWALRRGFVFPSSEIYGGFAAVYDLGPLGTELANALKCEWWREMVETRSDIVGLDSSILMHPKVWDASGHTEAFTDPLVDCADCKRRHRADHLYEEAGGEDADDLDLDALTAALKEKDVKCPNCEGALSEPRTFNLLMGAEMGVIEGEKDLVWLRGETAQGTYVNAHRVSESMRLQPPFGMAQIGKAFRNEITPKDFLFRVREFEQMEMQFLCRDEAQAKEQYAYWRERRMAYLRETIGLSEENTRYHEHSDAERAHYATAAEDVQFQFPFGWKELEGIHNRGTWDLTRHTEYSGQDLSFFDQQVGERFVPPIVETAGGVGRLMLAAMAQALEEESLEGDDTRMVARFKPAIAPVQVAVLPLSKKEALSGKSREVFQTILDGTPLRVQYDETQSIGKRYRRQDEIGTPLCVTVDFDSLDDDAVTVRDRDTMKQDRVKIAELAAALEAKF